MLGTVRRALGIGTLAAYGRAAATEVRVLAQLLGSTGIELKCDSKTGRLPILEKTGADPLIEPAGRGWRAGAVYDGRPILFRGRRLVYFCGQPAYRADMHLFVGVGEFIDGRFVVASRPVLVPDIEQRGIDIPAFTVFGDRVVGIYADNYGPKRTVRGIDADMVLVTSQDGQVFTKRAIASPFAGLEYDRIGLPWLLADEGRLRLFLSAKRQRQKFLVTAEVDVEAARIGRLEVAAQFRRKPVNVAVTKRGGTYILFYGATVGGGAYAAPSRDGRHWDFAQEVMLTSIDGSDWDWDLYKVCASPDNTTDARVELCYTAGVLIGHAAFDSAKLLAHWGNAG